jgi:hypothetical protein
MVSRSHKSAGSNSRSKQKEATTSLDPIVEGKKMTNDMIEYITDYARENPGNAALWCLGVGFVLGWKLKPW